MRVSINGAFNPVLTFLFHLIVLDWIWKFLEVNIDGETNGNWVDSIIIFIVCLYITWIASLKNESKE